MSKPPLAAIERILREVQSGQCDLEFDVARSTVKSDMLVAIVATGRASDSLNIRVLADSILLDVHGSEAVEFSTDDNDIKLIERIVRAFYTGDLEVLVGSKDGKYYALRADGTDILMPGSIVDRIRSGPREWKRVR